MEIAYKTLAKSRISPNPPKTSKSLKSPRTPKHFKKPIPDRLWGLIWGLASRSISPGSPKIKPHSLSGIGFFLFFCVFGDFEDFEVFGGLWGILDFAKVLQAFHIKMILFLWFYKLFHWKY